VPAQALKEAAIQKARVMEVIFFIFSPVEKKDKRLSSFCLFGMRCLNHPNQAKENAVFSKKRESIPQIHSSFEESAGYPAQFVQISVT
jgi:hypothetical protein